MALLSVIVNLFETAPDRPERPVHDRALLRTQAGAGLGDDCVDAPADRAAGIPSLLRQAQGAAVAPRAAAAAGEVAVFLQIVDRPGDGRLVLVAALAELRRRQLVIK